MWFDILFITVKQQKWSWPHTSFKLQIIKIIPEVRTGEMNLHLAAFIFFIGSTLPVVLLIIGITNKSSNRKFVIIRYGFTILTGSWLLMSFFAGDWLSTGLAEPGQLNLSFGYFAFQINNNTFFYHSASVDYNRARRDQISFMVFILFAHHHINL